MDDKFGLLDVQVINESLHPARHVFCKLDKFLNWNIHPRKNLIRIVGFKEDAFRSRLLINGSLDGLGLATLTCGLISDFQK